MDNLKMEVDNLEQDLRKEREKRYDQVQRHGQIRDKKLSLENENDELKEVIRLQKREILSWIQRAEETENEIEHLKTDLELLANTHRNYTVKTELKTTVAQTKVQGLREKVEALKAKIAALEAKAKVAALEE